ncbi:MAG: phosphoribosyltransferase family protein [Candidatus Moraniibacteriota bacterium]
MNEHEIMKVLSSVGAVITDNHIVYTSGRHGSVYVNKDAVYPHTKKTSALCKITAQNFADDSVDVVIAPAAGGIIISQWTAYHLSEITGRDVLGIYAEKEIMVIPDPEGKNRKCYFETGGFVIKRGYDKLVKGKNVLVTEDVLTTGGSAKKVIEAVRALGGNVVGLGVLCNRGNIKPSDVANPPRLFSLINVKLDSWDEGDCPLCGEDVPINTDVGKGREYLSKKM